MCKDNLKNELMKFKFAAWHQYTILEAMIDGGQIVEFKCQHPMCFHLEEGFNYKGTRGHPLNLTLDHIVPRRENGSHNISNLRIVHNRCNSGWRKDVKGSFLNDNSKKQISSSLKGRSLSNEHKKAIGNGNKKSYENGRISWCKGLKNPPGEVGQLSLSKLKGVHT